MTAAGATRRVTIPAHVRRAVLHDGAQCAYCWATAEAIDHVIPVVRGGTNDPDNLVAACGLCNGEKCDMTVDEWRAWRVARGMPWPVPSRSGALAQILGGLGGGWSPDMCAVYALMRMRPWPRALVEWHHGFTRRVHRGQCGTDDEERALLLAAVDAVLAEDEPP